MSRKDAHAFAASLADLIGVEGKTTRAPAVAKYRHPDNAALTWSGRGRKPQWFADHINAGKDLRELAVSGHRSGHGQFAGGSQLIATS